MFTVTDGRLHTFKTSSFPEVQEKLALIRRHWEARGYVQASFSSWKHSDGDVVTIGWSN